VGAGTFINTAVGVDKTRVFVGNAIVFVCDTDIAVGGIGVKVEVGGVVVASSDALINFTACSTTAVAATCVSTCPAGVGEVQAESNNNVIRVSE